MLGSVRIPDGIADGYGFSDIVGAGGFVFLATGGGVIRFRPGLCHR
jgi:hypothetical protein